MDESRKMLDEVLNPGLRKEATKVLAIEFTDIGSVSDANLVQAVLDGDERSFAVIFERHKRSVARTVGRFFRDRSEIEEHVQQAFTKAYFSLSRFRGGVDMSFAAWLLRITVNVCYDEFRRRQRKGESSFSLIGDEEIDYLETIADGRQPSAESRVATSQIVERIMAGLAAEDRVAMTMVYCEEYSLEEVARAIGITRSNLKSRLFRCRKQIRERFERIFE